LTRGIGPHEIIDLSDDGIDGTGPRVIDGPQESDLEIDPFGKSPLYRAFAGLERVEDAQERFDLHGFPESTAGPSLADGLEEGFADECGKVGEDTREVFALEQAIKPS